METTTCQNCKNIFKIDQNDRDFYEKIKVPYPTWCPLCRMIRRFNYRNEDFLFRRIDGHNNQEIFSGFSPDASVTTFENKYWFSDDWDQLESEREYDFSKPFFEQIAQLLKTAPIPARSVLNMVNSDYCNEASECKNCYLCFNADYLEDSAYLKKSNHIKNSFDLFECYNNELCYESVMVDDSYKTFYSNDCESCVDVWFSRGLRGCTNCFGCVNLKNKSYYWFNQPLSKEEYSQRLKEYNSGSYQESENKKKEVENFLKNFPVKYNHTLRTLNSTGERVYDTKNALDCYTVRESEDVRYCQDIQRKASNAYDYSVWGEGADSIYECMTCGMGVYNLKFCFNCFENSKNLEYCIYCLGSSDCFGCVGLYKKQYCILNKQYSKEEYFELVSKIKKQMEEIPYIDKKGRAYKYGEFFPQELSPVAYNESVAQNFFPLTKEIAEEKGYVWRENKQKEYKETFLLENLEDTIQNTNESITKEILKCIQCEKAYRAIATEFQFYKRMCLPFPRKCADCRFKDRFKQINIPILRAGKCMNQKSGENKPCENVFLTSYNKESGYIIYCEECYQKEVN